MIISKRIGLAWKNTQSAEDVYGEQKLSGQRSWMCFQAGMKEH